MANRSDIVPVIMFHSVGLRGTDWAFSYISEPFEPFERKLEMLATRRYRTIHWAELFDHMAGHTKLPARTVMLTFDDGYLDNWVYVFPLIKRYGIKITIFVNPEFVDPTERSRQTLEDVWERRTEIDELQPAGFLSWNELRAMEQSGLVDVQSHALSHTWYFSGPDVIDFHRPDNNSYPWLAWNMRPERKPFYMVEDQSDFVPWGFPIYEHEKALTCRRYFPPQEVTDRIVDLVAEEGGPSFFKREGWEVRLKQYHRELVLTAKGDHYEGEEEYERRVFDELVRSKAILEEELSKIVEFICWPGGAYNAFVLGAAKEAGYKSWTLSSRDQSDFRNRHGVCPQQIKRIGSAPTYIGRNGKDLGYSSPGYLYAVMERHRCSLYHKWLSRIPPLTAMIKESLGAKQR